jgi:hypothetical protein
MTAGESLLISAGQRHEDQQNGKARSGAQAEAAKTDHSDAKAQEKVSPACQIGEKSRGKAGDAGHQSASGSKRTGLRQAQAQRSRNQRQDHRDHPVEEMLDHVGRRVRCEPAPSGKRRCECLCALDLSQWFFPDDYRLV